MSDDLKLANETQVEDPGFPDHCCQCCGYDLSNWTEGRWKNGPKDCDECPNCHRFPRWMNTGGKTEKRRAVCTCKHCKEPFVQWLRCTVYEKYLESGPRKTVVRPWEENETCRACSALFRAKDYAQRAVKFQKESEELRAQQRRGVEQFKKAGGT
jgi:hypothetical protein